MNITIQRCPTHNYWAITIDTPGVGGTRITPSKCCGSWETVKTWPMDERGWAEIERLAVEARDTQ